MTALRIETQIVVAAPIATAWAVLTDFTSYQDWNPYLVRIEGEARAGATITVHARPLPDAPPLVQDIAVVSVEPGTMRWEGGLPDRGQFKGDHWFVLEPEEGGTLLNHYEAFSGSLAAAILAEHRETIVANFERFNTAFKTRAESLAS